MLKTKIIKIKSKGKIAIYYKKLGYIENELGILCINIKDLTTGSTVRVDVICDICNEEKTIKYQDYIRSFHDNMYCCMKCKQHTFKKTCLEKYGVDNIFQLPEVKEKIKKTNKKKYGVDNPMKNDIIKEKNKKTCLKKYGYTTASQNEKIKQKMLKTNLLKWGSTCTLHSTKLKDKIKQIFIQKYGVDNPMKNNEIWIKSQKTGLKRKLYNNTKLLYQGSYEKHFLDKYSDILHIKNGISFKYLLNDIKHVYHSDFFIPKLNLVIEIKSSYWFEKYKDKNNIKKETCLLEGYNFLFIIDKKYDEFEKYLY